MSNPTKEVYKISTERVLTEGAGYLSERDDHVS